MTISFEIPREHIDKWPPFSDGCETCLGAGFDGTVVPHATVTYGDSLMAFYHHGRCGKQWYTSFLAQWDHTWQRVEGSPRPVKGRQLRALPPSEQSA
jgi:hypothetical protein